MMTAHLEAQVVEPAAHHAVPFTAPAPVDASPHGGHAGQPLAQMLRDRVRSIYPK